MFLLVQYIRLSVLRLVYVSETSMTIARAISGKASFGLLQELDFVTDETVLPLQLVCQCETTIKRSLNIHWSLLTTNHGPITGWFSNSVSCAVIQDEPKRTHSWRAAQHLGYGAMFNFPHWERQKQRPRYNATSYTEPQTPCLVRLCFCQTDLEERPVTRKGLSLQVSQPSQV